jgi:hypothetical protein
MFQAQVKFWMAAPEPETAHVGSFIKLSRGRGRRSEFHTSTDKQCFWKAEEDQNQHEGIKNGGKLENPCTRLVCVSSMYRWFTYISSLRIGR